MLWILVSLFFWWMIFRECYTHLVAPAGFDRPDPTPISKTYLAVLLTLALLSAWPPFKTWRFERFLSAKATELADFRPATVHCNTLFDSFFTGIHLAAGLAKPETGEIIMEHKWCDNLMAYLDHPDRANRTEIYSLNVFTHESMHIRGEYNEALTECQAVQRDYRAAKLLGVPDSIAKKNALDFYYGSYMMHATIGGMHAPYFSDQCAPGKALDEHLSDSTWIGLDSASGSVTANH